MTVNEMHIAVNLGVQKLASFQVDNLLPEEIDHELNLAQLRFIKQRFSTRSNRVGKGFEQSQKRIDDLKSLVVEHQDSTQYYGEVYTSKYSPVYVDRYTLPLDYLFLVSVRAETKYSCTIPPEQRKVITNLRYVKLDLTPPIKGYLLQDLYVFKSSSATWVKINNISLSTFDKLMNSTNYILDIHPTLALPEQNSAGITQHISPNVDSNHLYLQFKFNIALDVISNESDPLYNKCFYAVWVNPLDNTQTALVYNNEFITLSTETRDFKTNSAIPLYNKISYCTFAQHDDIYALLDDPFNRTDFDLPFYNIEESYLDIYTTNMFIAKKAIIKYLRKPIAISYNLGVGCELPFHTHEEITEMTIKSILEGLESQRYNTQSMETFESE
jgi:hypothetical protein